VNERYTRPDPHVASHDVHSVHAPSQSTGHAPVLHEAVSLSSVHDEPPQSAAVVTVNVLSLVPPPQVAEQAPYVPHCPTQSCTQHVVPHSCVFVSSCAVSHVRPPFDAGVDTENVFACTPPPHVTEHESQPDQLPTQSTGQSSVLQS